MRVDDAAQPCRIRRSRRNRPLALSAAAGFLLSLLSLGLYAQRAFRRDLAAATVAFPAGPSGSSAAGLAGQAVTRRPIPRASSHSDQPM